MREVIAVCRSSKRARVRVAMVLDRYFWRIGDRTWRGRASNACLDRVAREIRAGAKRNTAVTIHEIRSARESRLPIVRIGSRRAFSPEGLAPVAAHPDRSGRWPPRAERERHLLALVRVAALFHDLGKATRLFQDKLRRALKGRGTSEPDAVRHDLHSAVVWDLLAGQLDDGDLIERLRTLEPADVDAACTEAVERLRRLHDNPARPMNDGQRTDLAFALREGTISHAVGMLILTHHRLPDGSSNHLDLLAGRHVRAEAPLDTSHLQVAKGVPFWHDERWHSWLRRATDDLRSGASAPGLDMALRATLMFADHLGSNASEPREEVAAHLANTKLGKAADPLDLHVRRVLERVPGAFDMLHRHRERYPALAEDKIPLAVRHPEPAPEPFGWQTVAADSAGGLCAAREGGFFACLVAGTGTGKTRGAPTVLAAAAFADTRPERRALRMTLGLGLVALADQSARAYVDDLGFGGEDVALLVGQAPVRFGDNDADEAEDGSESLIALPDWLRVERAGAGVPPEGSEQEADWLRRLSHDVDRGLPATLDLAIEAAGRRGGAARLLAASPVVVGTIDHLMAVASPSKSQFLFPLVRVLTADLILDEIDQYDPEDIAAIGRLVFQAAAGGRRVVVMSATLTADVAQALHRSYREGWRIHADVSGMADHVNILCSADATGSCFTNAAGQDFSAVFAACREATLAALARRPPHRRGRILPACEGWEELVAQVDQACHELHDATAAAIDGLRVSVGFVRMTRIAHAAALAVQLPAGVRENRLRLKLCLHSQFPRLHRAWIERELKRALSRQGSDPDAGLRALLSREGHLERARSLGCQHVEVVIVTSPVIETGNDLDFDWAVIDPSSMRALVQAAGRVWRHRIYGGHGPNVLILGRSPIAMVAGKLVKPGVETPPHPDTLVSRMSLSAFEGRRFADLAGAETFERIDAGMLLREEGDVPLRAAEAKLRQAMVQADGLDDPLGCYIRRQTARLNLRMTRSRTFRRGTTRDLLFVQDEGPEGPEWFVDLAPGTRHSELRLARNHGLHFRTDQDEHTLFSDLAKAAWAAYHPDGDAIIGSDLRRMMRMLIPDDQDTTPTVTYGEWTGFTRGRPDDLLQPFGKQLRKQYED